MAIPLPARLGAAHAAVAAYSALAAIISAARSVSYPNAWFAVVAHLLLIVLILLVARRAPHARWAGIASDALPLLSLIALYTLIDVVNLGGNVATWDAEVQRVEERLFLGQPARDWWRSAPSVFWSTLLHGAYFSYYALIAAPALILLAHGRPVEREFFVTRVITCFMLCYAVFVLFPVSGPYYQFERPTGEFVANLPAQLVYASLSGGSSFGAAFPSSHVAATVTCTVALLRVRPRLGAVLVVPAALLTVSVVYCAMHYAVDAIAGLGVGLTVGLWPAQSLRVDLRRAAAAS